MSIICILQSRGLASSVVAQEGGDLPLIESQRESVHSQLLSVTVDLHKVFDVNTRLDMSRLLLNAHS